MFTKQNQHHPKRSWLLLYNLIAVSSEAGLEKIAIIWGTCIYLQYSTSEGFLTD